MSFIDALINNEDSVLLTMVKRDLYFLRLITKWQQMDIYSGLSEIDYRVLHNTVK